MLKAGGGHFTYGLNPRGVNTSRFISCKNSCARARRCRSDARRHPGLQGNAGLGDQIHHIQAQPVDPTIGPEPQTFFSSARTAGFSQLRSACLVQRDANSTVRFPHASATHYAKF